MAKCAIKTNQLAFEMRGAKYEDVYENLCEDVANALGVNPGDVKYELKMGGAVITFEVDGVDADLIKAAVRR